MSDTDVTPEKPKAKALASGIEVWCAHERLSPIEELKPNPRNPNKHPEEQLELLAKNIRYFGWRHCITVSKRSGCIVAGHGRMLAAQKLDARLVPVDYQDFASDDEELAVLLADTLSGWITLLASAIAVNPALVSFLPEPARHLITTAAGFVAVASGGTFAAQAKDRQVTGAGFWGFTPAVDGNDIVVRGAVATWFGGEDDPVDNGETASGISTKKRPQIEGCALPMDFGPCKGSPIPRVPWGTKLDVFQVANGKKITVPVIDLGPARGTGHGFDLTPAAFKRFAVLSEGRVKVDYRIPGAMRYTVRI